MLDDYLDRKLQPIVNGLHELHTSIANRNYIKPQVTSIVTPFITLTSLREKYGWSISNDAFAAGNRHETSHGSGKNPPAPLAWSKRALDPADRADLEQWLMLHSHAASGRWVKINGQYVDVQYLDNPIKQLHNLWKSDSNHRQMSYSCFRKTIKKLKKFKDPRQRGTDLCDTCIHGRSIEKQLKRSISQHGSHCVGRRSIESLISQYNTDSTESMIDQQLQSVIDITSLHSRSLDSIGPDLEFDCTCGEMFPSDLIHRLKSLFIFYHHHALKTHSRRAYRSAIKSLKVNEAILVHDWKENIAINRGPNEPSYSFFARSLRSVFGTLLIWRDPVSQCIRKQYIDAISMCLSHDTITTHELISHIVHQYVQIPHPTIHTIHIFSDSGPHFKSTQGLGSNLVKLQQLTGLKIHIHWFVEGHGKSDVDGHFSKLAGWLREAICERAITTTEELIEAFREAARKHQVTDGISYSCFEYRPKCHDNTHDHYSNPASNNTNAEAINALNVQEQIGVNEDGDEIEVRYERMEGRVECKRPVHREYQLKLEAHELFAYYHFECDSTNIVASHFDASVSANCKTTKMQLEAQVTSSSQIQPLVGSFQSYSSLSRKIAFAPRLKEIDLNTVYSVRPSKVLAKRAASSQTSSRIDAIPLKRKRLDNQPNAAAE